MITRKNFVNIILQTIFWIATAYWFTRNSFIRPCAASYKEILCALFIAATVYFNYLILIPLFYKKRKYFLYFFLSFSCALLCATSEYLLVKHSVISCIGHALDAALLPKYMINIFVCITLRDLSFLCFFILLRFYQLIIYNTERQKKALAGEKHILSIMPDANTIINLNINKICYFKNNKNAVDIIMTNQCKYQQYMSLSDIENILPKSLYIRVNRSNLVMLKYVAGYTDYELYIKPDNESISFFQTKPQVVKSMLYKWNPDLYRQNDSKSAVSDTSFSGNADEEKLPKEVPFGVEKPVLCDEFLQNGVERRSILEEKPKLGLLYDYIKAHPYVKLQELSEALIIPQRSVQRMLKSLRDEHLIVHIGSRGKNSGYQVTDKD